MPKEPPANWPHACGKVHTEVIKSEGVVTSLLCAVTKVSWNARNLMPQFLAELPGDGVCEDQRKL